MIKRPHGFTLVELLIVIVVVAILATITTVSYNKIQERAHNAITISAANQAITLLTLHYTLEGPLAINDLPPWAHYVCMGDPDEFPPSNGLRDGECHPDAFASNQLQTALSSVGKANFKTYEFDEGGHYVRGIVYTYDNGNQGSAPAGGEPGYYLTYALVGTNQDCGIPSADVATSSMDNETWCSVNMTTLIGGNPITW